MQLSLRRALLIWGKVVAVLVAAWIVLVSLPVFLADEPPLSQKEINSLLVSLLANAVLLGLFCFLVVAVPLGLVMWCIRTPRLERLRRLLRANSSRVQLALTSVTVLVALGVLVFA